MISSGPAHAFFLIYYVYLIIFTFFIELISVVFHSPLLSYMYMRIIILILGS